LFNFEDEANFVDDREDLLTVLRMRFGDIAPGIVEEVYKINDLDTLERLILVAANSPDLKTFLTELEEGKEGFKIVGEQFNPIETLISGGDDDGETN
jgi:hypothetical protein